MLDLIYFRMFKLVDWKNEVAWLYGGIVLSFESALLPTICEWCHYCFEAEEEALLPAAGTEGYQFDPHTQIPSEGFKFWRWLQPQLKAVWTGRRHLEPPCYPRCLEFQLWRKRKSEPVLLRISAMKKRTQLNSCGNFQQWMETHSVWNFKYNVKLLKYVEQRRMPLSPTAAQLFPPTLLFLVNKTCVRLTAQRCGKQVARSQSRRWSCVCRGS
jgi:hypothetical protein